MRSKILFILILFLALNMIHCDKLWGNGDPTSGTSPPSQSINSCQLYRIQSYIIDCHKKSKYFNPVSEQEKEDIAPEDLRSMEEKRKKIIEIACAQQAFSTILGINAAPSSTRENSENDILHWRFTIGNKVMGNMPFPPSPVERFYHHALTQFKRSIDTQQMNSCLGGNYSGDGPTMVKTSFEAVHLGFLEPEVFRKCYRQQLELYRAKHSCSAI